MNPRRVVVTGYGAITPVGSTVEIMWQALLRGESGIRRIERFAEAGLPVEFGGEPLDFDATDYLPKQSIRRLDRFAQYGFAAAAQAMEHAKLTIDKARADRYAVLIGSGYGAMQTILAAPEQIATKGPRGISPFFAVTSAIDSAAAEVSCQFGAEGPSRALSSACATGTDAIGQATRWIQTNDADVVITGGAEHILTVADVASNANARALSRRNNDPAAACRPFDEDRDGFVIGAGAGILVLEAEEHAHRRGAEILAEIVGYAASSDAHHLTAPHPEGLGARRALASAIAEAGIEPSQVGYVNAHGTGTPLNDPTEIAAIRSVLGDHVRAIPISSIKSMVGHMIGAAGAMEAIATIQTLRTGLVPPTINCPRPLVGDINFVTDGAQRHDVEFALSNSFGFGGHNAVLALRRAD